MGRGQGGYRSFPSSPGLRCLPGRVAVAVRMRFSSSLPPGGRGGGRKDIAVALFILLILILFVSSISITPSLLHLQSGRFIGTQGGVVVTISSRYCTRCTRGTLEKGWHCYWSLAAVLKLRGGTTDSAGGKVAAALLRKMISIICS